MGVYYKQRRTLKKNRNVYDYAVSCKRSTKKKMPKPSVPVKSLEPSNRLWSTREQLVRLFSACPHNHPLYKNHRCKNRPITDYCDRNEYQDRLWAEQALSLFAALTERYPIIPENGCNFITSFFFCNRVLLSLNCLVFGDKPDKTFAVEIEEGESVSILKDLIKEKKISMRQISTSGRSPSLSIRNQMRRWKRWIWTPSNYYQVGRSWTRSFLPVPTIAWISW